MTTNLPVELSGYQAAAADLARIVADLRVLPGAEKPPYLALSILPEKSVEAVDTVALAVLGKRGATRRDSDGWRHIAEGRVGAVFVSVHAVVPGPPDERDLELESLRAEVEELRADRVGQLYSREADDPTPVSGARVEPHVGGMTEGGLVDETPAEPCRDPVTGLHLNPCTCPAWSDDDAAIEAADDAEARRTGGTFAQHYLGPREAKPLDTGGYWTPSDGPR